MNPQAEGTVYPEIPFEVTPERVGAFRKVFGLDEGVPPTFATAAEFAILPTIVADPRLELDFTRVVHGGQAYEIARPLLEGESLTVRARIDSIKVRAGVGFITLAIDLVGSDGETAVSCRSTMIERASS